MTSYEKLPESFGARGGTYVKVDWELGDKYDDDDHMTFHQSTGISEEGHMFEGSGECVDGEWTDVVDAEFIGMQQWLPEKDK
jgi:hypothetical protein